MVTLLDKNNKKIININQEYVEDFNIDETAVEFIFHLNITDAEFFKPIFDVARASAIRETQTFVKEYLDVMMDEPSSLYES